jgi:hypothetical protein
MNQHYPDRHHPVFFLQDSLQAEGVQAEFNSRDERTKGMWGLIIGGKPFVWLIDNRWTHEAKTEDPSARDMIAKGALVCCAQKPDAERIGAKWLPLAVTPEYKPPATPVRQLTDVAFVGYIRDKGREQMLLDLNAHFSISVSQGHFGNAAVSAYHLARLGMNIPTRYGHPQAYDSANMRCFEILATGTPLVTAYQDYLSELGLEHGFNCFLYKSPQDCIEVILNALAQRDLAIIGKQAAQLANERHTYGHRAKQVLEWLRD